MTASSRDDRRHIERNVRVHNKVATKYDATHGEIFNDLEQRRLAGGLRRARDEVRTGAEPLRALDHGCGSGNITSHLLGLGFEVVAADISGEFLDLVEKRHGGRGLSTLLLNGSDFTPLPDASFDLVATYSVLHHIPDYLGAVREMARVCKVGGIIYLDHEPTEDFWNNDPAYVAYRAAVERLDWRRYCVASNYVHKLIRVFSPRYTNEGDIHVWADDHVDWSRVVGVLRDEGFEVVFDEEYLLYRDNYRADAYRRYAGTVTDTTLMVFRRIAG